MHPAAPPAGSLFAILALLNACATNPAPGGNTVGVSPAPPVVTYSTPDPALLARIAVAFVQSSADTRPLFATMPTERAPFGSRAVVIQHADTTRPAPWTTRVIVQDTPDARKALHVEIRDHATYGVSHLWLNDRLLFLRVWWGRIVSTDLVVNAETGRIIHAEDAAYTGVIQPPLAPRFVQPAP